VGALTLSEIIKEAQPKMTSQLNRFEEEIKKIHVGRAESNIVEDVVVSYYNTNMPLKQMASISTPSPNLIVVTPWDKNALGDIELAIKNAQMSLNPTNDGNVIHINLPPLSQERRQEMTKMIHNMAEEVRISFRTIRQDIWQRVVQAERAHELSEDDRYKGEEQLNKTISDFNKQVDEKVTQKEKDIMTI